MNVAWKIIVIVFVMMSSAPAYAGDVAVLTWGDCLREAAKNNPELAASREVINQRKAQKRVATSPMLPQISAEASTSRTNTFGGGNSRDNNTYSARGEQLIFDGFKTYNEFKSAQQDIDASLNSFTSTSAGIHYNLRKAFAELLAAQELVPITKGIVARRQQNLDMLQLRYESGREHQGALLLAEADFAQAEYDYRKARRDVSTAQYALRKELGRSDDAPLHVKGNFALHTNLNDKPNLRKIAEGHPDVKRVAAERGAASYDYKAAKSEFFPTLSFNAEAGRVRVGGFNNDNGWSVGVGASLPIFEGGRRIANTDRTKARLMETANSETSTFDTVLSDLESAWQQLKDSAEYYDVQKKYLEADEVRAKIARAQYANGLLIFDNWIIIEDNYVRSQKAYVAAEADMMIAEANWKRARGEALGYE